MVATPQIGRKLRARRTHKQQADRRMVSPQLHATLPAPAFANMTGAQAAAYLLREDVGGVFDESRWPGTSQEVAGRLREQAERRGGE